MGLVWRRGGHWHWFGRPPGWRQNWVEATCMAPADRPEYWVLRLSGGDHLGDFPRAETAMRYADSLWDAWAVARRL